MSEVNAEDFSSGTVRILSIETSCDETAVSLIEASGGIGAPQYKILGNALHSQIDIHTEYGGVFPILAKREHAKNLVPLLAKAISLAEEHTTQDTAIEPIPELTDALKLEIKEILSREDGLYDALIPFLESSEIPTIDCIAVTEGPGLEPALWVGVSFAKALSVALQKPLVPVNHMEGHIVSVLMNENISAEQIEQGKDSTKIQFPALALLISGGHTELVLSENWHRYKIIGQTLDDAIGEAFDKVARLMDLPYPGGPKISKLAAKSRAQNLTTQIEKETGAKPWQLPRPMIHSKDFNFSFSGLKTAVLYAVKEKLKTRTDSADVNTMSANQLTDIEKKTLAEEFENAVTEVLVSKTQSAIEETGATTLIIGGGVVANVYIRDAFKKLATQDGINLYTPSISLSTDNSVMIGIAGYLRFIAGDAKILQPDDAKLLSARGNLSL